MMTWAARTHAANSRQKARVLGVELGRVQRAEHGQEPGVGLLVLGQRVAAGIEGPGPEPA